MCQTYDLVVVGAGAAGLTAAAVAAAEGQKVLVLEASEWIGGTTAISGGMVWIPANHKMAEVGIADSLEGANEYLDGTLSSEADRSVRAAFLARGDEMVRFLEARTAVRLRCVRTYPDYYPELKGSTAGGRVLEPVPFDGRQLGEAFARLRPPLPEFTLLGGMMVSREDIPHFRRITRSFRSFARVSNLVLRYLIQRLGATRGTTLFLGNALAARLYKSVLDLGVDIRLGTKGERLIRSDGRVVGIEVSDQSHSRIVRARRGVVLSTGGISHDSDLRRRYVPVESGNLSATVDPGAGRSGARLALEIGAQMRNSCDCGAFWVPSSCFTRTDGSKGRFPHTVTDRAKPGLIAVDSTGKRFVNEAVTYHEFGLAQLRAPAHRIPAYLICDRRFLWKYGLGRVKPFSVTLGAQIQSGYLKRAPTLTSLAKALGIAPDALVTTVAAFNADAAQGVDREFGRGANIYQRHLGDADHRPNPCVAPVETSPFYAVAVYPADLGMSAGIITDPSARVLDGQGVAIPGLYACGNDMNSVMDGAYPGPGVTLGPAMTFAYIAAKHAATVT
jgi:succinate dehydrogenase/fumarate reductase flavoprotein subunit